MLIEGTGVEVSPSRHRFAEAWKAARGSDRIRNVESSVHTYTFDRTGLDLVVAIDGALSYLYPFDPDLPARVLADAQRCLKPGGKVVLEFDVMRADKVRAMMSDGHIRTWYRGDEKDAFGFALYETSPVDADRMLVRNLSIYLPRDASDPRVKQEHYKYYSTDELRTLLDDTGFEANFHGSFDLDPYSDESAALVVVATRR